MPDAYKYHLALSLAEEDLPIGEAIAHALQSRGIAYYLYTEHEGENLGKPIMHIVNKVYGEEARHVVLLTSINFVQKFWTSIESLVIQIAAAKRQDFILRICIDDTPVDGIGKHIVALKWQDNPEQIADILLQKLKSDEAGDPDSPVEPMPFGSAQQGGRIEALPKPAMLHGKFFKRAGIVAGIALAGFTLLWLVVRSIPREATPRQYGMDNGKSPSSRESVKNKGTTVPEKVHVPAGSFMLGRDGGWSIWQPMHKVTLTAFAISKTEVTVTQYKAFCNATGAVMPPPPPYHSSEDNPVVNITWAEALAYCHWLGGRLPTEAEWEYAATVNGETSHRYSGANAIGTVGYYFTNATGGAHPVAQKNANAIGCFDMSGNVSEWCQDWLGKYLPGDQLNPQGPATGTRKVIRGGHYLSKVANDSSANELLTAYRDHEDPALRKPFIGFRVVWDP